MTKIQVWFYDFFFVLSFCLSRSTYFSSLCSVLVWNLYQKI